MPKAVRYDEFGGIDVLRVDEVARPVPGDGQVPEPPGESARSPSSSRTVPGPRSSAWRARATTRG